MKIKLTNILRGKKTKKKKMDIQSEIEVDKEDFKRKQRNKCRKNNRFKKLNFKKEKKRKTPQNCKSPTYRQRFLTTIKNVTEKKNLKTLIGFLTANKSTTIHKNKLKMD